MRRTLAVALLAAVLGPPVGAVVDARPDAHGCADGVCRCGHARPAAPVAPAPCHDGARETAPDCQMSARCHHEAPAFPAAQSPALIRAAQKPACDHVPAGPLRAPAAAIRTGFDRITSPPPRPA